MITKKTENGILVTDIDTFDVPSCLESGQCFRFERTSGGYSLVACGRRLVISECDGGWLFENVSEQDFESVWADYFDLKRDYNSIIESFAGDKVIYRAANACRGIRILRQDPWETTVSFIISQNNNIPRIKKIIESLCVLVGRKNPDGSYAFPTPDDILALGVEGLAPIKSGFRAKYLVSAAEMTLSGLTPEYIDSLDYDSALAELKKIKGVGDKVANCILLFGYRKYGAFPIDVWVKRIIDKYYGGSFDPSALGKYAGIAQQYLFHYERVLGGEKE